MAQQTLGFGATGADPFTLSVAAGACIGSGVEGPVVFVALPRLRYPHSAGSG